MTLIILKEFVYFLKHKKKLWLIPILIVALLIGAILAIAEGTVISPLVYTLF